MRLEKANRLKEEKKKFAFGFHGSDIQINDRGLVREILFCFD
jgi:hypothetical protein